MLGAGLLGVGASHDFCACNAPSIPLLRIHKIAVGWAHTVLDGLLCVEAVMPLASPINCKRPRRHVRSLLSSKALEQHLGVAVDAEVLDRLRILRRARRILPGRGFGKRRAQRLSDCLHRDCEAATKAEVQVRERIVERVMDGAGLNDLSCDIAGLLRASLANLDSPHPGPVRARQLHENTSLISALVQPRYWPRQYLIVVCGRHLNCMHNSHISPVWMHGQRGYC